MAPLLSDQSVNPLIIFARAVSDEKPDLTCPRPLANPPPGAPLFGPGSVNLHQLMIYICGPSLIVTIISCFFLSWRHVHRYTNPQEQRQILRIVNLPIAYGLFNFLAILFTVDYLYIEPIAQVYEALTTAALFFLVLEWVCPDGTDREKYFDNLELRNRRGQPVPGGSLKWFQRTWQMSLQYPVLKPILVAIQIVTQYYGVYCESSWSPKTAHLWLTLIDYFFVGGAIGAVIRFSRRVRGEFAPIHKPHAKIWTFLIMLIFQIIQDLIFHILNGKLFSPTAKATYNDINFGISSLLTCVEAVIFSLIFQWAYSSGEYKEGAKLDRLGSGPAQRTKTFRAFLDALNLSDIIAGSFVAFQLLFMRVRSRYGGSSGPQRQKTLTQEDQVHLEPLAARQQRFGSDQAYVQASQYDEGYSPPPPMPPTARDPSPGAPYGRAQTFRNDALRPGVARQDSYPRTGYAREESPESQPLQQARSYM